jgi:hypothetical protein
MSSCVFTKKQFNELTGPCVYMFIRKGTVLYVGYSNVGVRRFLAFGHQASEARYEADEIRVFWLPSSSSVNRRRQEALFAEAVAIYLLQPRYNKTLDHDPRVEPGTSTGNKDLDDFLKMSWVLT